ncbi:hypothetical protein BCR37DRAFT_391568 [Protomyces lactucae-debilis]|uniref:RING-type domain-containing protein n=1 Tax=Protomyces lactucae-debilis TaxID=2754530 RepID=A0A1Y2FLF6_PROLT|nr:uncharacterized protein BCR37DRAFT_391568 [Protomyces lactucae-debilis]ORY84800.1 hypothetical protein BCR37DRAFT_391568 [Protomyces lactucae-debilis]
MAQSDVLTTPGHSPSAPVSSGPIPRPTLPNKPLSKTQRFSKLLSGKPDSLRSKSSASPMPDGSSTEQLPLPKTSNSSFFRRLSRKSNLSRQHCQICDESLGLLVSGERVLTFLYCHHLVHGHCLKDQDKYSESLVEAPCPLCCKIKDSIKLEPPIQTWTPNTVSSLPVLSPTRSSTGTIGSKSVAASIKSADAAMPSSGVPPVPKTRMPSTTQEIKRGMRVPFPYVSMELAMTDYRDMKHVSADATTTLTELMLTVAVPEKCANLDNNAVLTPPLTAPGLNPMRVHSPGTAHFPIALTIIVQLEDGDLDQCSTLKSTLLDLCEQLSPFDEVGIIAFNAAEEYAQVCSLVGSTHLTDLIRCIKGMAPSSSLREGREAHGLPVSGQWQRGDLSKVFEVVLSWFKRDKRPVLQQQIFFMSNLVPNLQPDVMGRIARQRIHMHVFAIGVQHDSLAMFQLAHQTGGQFIAVPTLHQLAQRALALLFGIFSLAYTQLAVDVELLDEAGQTVPCSMSSSHMRFDTRLVHQGLRMHFGPICHGESRQLFIKVNRPANIFYCQITLRGKFTNKQRTWTGLNHVVLPVPVEWKKPSHAFQFRKLEEVAGAMLFHAVDLATQGKVDFAERVMDETRRVLLKQAEAHITAALGNEQGTDTEGEEVAGLILSLEGDLDDWLNQFSAAQDETPSSQQHLLALGLEMGRTLLLQQAWTLETNLSSVARSYACKVKLLKDMIDMADSCF